jgi:hypothetical protein
VSLLAHALVMITPITYPPPVSRTTHPTARTIAPGAEALLGQELRALDLGFVQPVDYMGNDLDIVQAART